MSDLNVVMSEGVGTKIYCKNEKCPKNKKLKEPIVFKFSPIVTPFEGDFCKGECSTSPYFCEYAYAKGDVSYEGAGCSVTKRGSLGCGRVDCVHNENKQCTRHEILVDLLKDLGFWVCKCFAFRKIRGHTDWSALLQGGHAKGGHISDADAEKMNKYAKTTRSYRTHMKQF